jgi:hypothetical protein
VNAICVKAQAPPIARASRFSHCVPVHRLEQGVAFAEPPQRLWPGSVVVPRGHQEDRAAGPRIASAVDGAVASLDVCQEPCSLGNKCELPVRISNFFSLSAILKRRLNVCTGLVNCHQTFMTRVWGGATRLQISRKAFKFQTGVKLQSIFLSSSCKLSYAGPAV